MSSPPRVLGWAERFLAPSLTEILAEQRGLNRRMDDLREDLNRRMDRLEIRMDGLERSMDTRLTEIQSGIMQVQNSLVTALAHEAVRTRLTAPEAERHIVPPHHEPPEHDKGGLER